MKITIEIPDTTPCVILNYVYLSKETGGLMLASRNIGTDDIHRGEVIVCDEQ